jgi:uncharacterized Zn finger protein
MIKIVTHEECPVCGLPVEVEHGLLEAGTDLYVHVEHCPDCGDMYPTVLYDCPHCQQAQPIRR